MEELAFIKDGSVATIGLALGLLNMASNYCPYDGCLAKNERQPYHNLSYGNVVYDRRKVGSELYYRYDTNTAFGPFHQTVGFSITDSGSLWIGAGSIGKYPIGDNGWFVELHSMPGLYLKGDGIDIGGTIEFRSGFAVGYETDNGSKLAITVDHRSNAEIYRENPGLETVQLRLSIPVQ